MNKTIFLQIIIKKCAFLEKEGFSFSQVGNNIFYTSISETEGFRIKWHYTEYGEKFHVYGPVAEKRFNVVEQEIQKVLGGNLTDFYTIYKNHSMTDIPKDLLYNKYNDSFWFILETENETNIFCDFVTQFYFEIAINFYKDYVRLDYIDRQLKVLLDTKNMQSILSSLDNATIIRFYIIAIISENQSIKDFFELTYFPYLKKNLDKERIKIENDWFERIQKNNGIEKDFR